ncbi:MAG: penicillin acylase family protein, partial [Melioribacteraceae bacterium]|nr:penicillin acylase family protein [Melioribacteraceae bacterium]
ILPDYDENAPTIIPDGLENLTAVATDIYEVDKKFREFMGFVGTHIGSNSWVVNAEKSASGKVLIANDPHLAFQAPGKFLFAVVRSDEWNAEGFSIPGLPVFIIGKNQNISWGLTNVMTDDADFYVEKLDSSRTKYLLNNNWNDLEIRKDTIIVKDSSNVEIEIRSTHRGPIISDIHTYNVLFKNDYQNRADMSMRWTALDLTDEIFAAISINKAANWKEFKTGLEYFIAPGQNFIYGDKEGNIGYVCATKLPMRESYSPTLIYDGTTDRYDWKGFVPYDKMPKLFNPSQNYIASANNKTIKDFPYHISNIWEPSSRIDRIKELLNSKENHSIEDFKKYQLDFYSFYAKDITKYILSAFKNASIKDDNL